MVPTCSGSYADTNVANPAKARLSPLGTSREFSYIVVMLRLPVTGILVQFD